jgi:hypothetical protein
MRLTIFLLLFSLSAQGQFIIDSYRFGKGDTLLLDDYANAAAAYSLRLLRTAYTGDAIMVRRSSDGDSLNIGFSTNYLDTIALKTFCGTGGSDSCFIRTWYDQSGNNKNASQTTSASQPIILSAGVILRKYGQPNIVFNNQHLVIGTQIILNDQLTLVSVFNTDTTGSPSAGLINYWSASPMEDPELRIGINNSIFDYYNNGYVFNNVNISANTGGLYFYQRLTGYFSRIFRNSSQIGSDSATRSGILGTGVTEFTIGRYLRVNGNRNGNISEMIVYPSDQSANRTAIETNINNFYQIY